MALSEAEKDLIAQALQLYVHQARAQLPPASASQIMTVAQGIIGKLDSLAAGAEDVPGKPPAGISEEWFTKVCSECDHLTAAGCTDKITVKFPGKCDPILKYERKKAALG